MATIFKASGGSIQGSDYEVFFDDGAPSVTSQEMPLAGVSISYKTNEDDVDANLLLSTCSVTILAKSSVDRSKILQVTNGNEGQNKIRVLKNGALEWAGIIQIELSEELDEPLPQLYTITATDGLGRLKNIEYVGGLLNADLRVKVIDHIKNILEQTPVIDYYSAGEVFLRINSTLWPDQLTPNEGQDVFNSLRVSSKAFRVVDKSGEVIYRDNYDVLLQICRAFGLRIMYAGGHFVLSEIVNVARQDEELRWNKYDKDFNALSQDVLTDWSTWQINVGDDITPANSAKMLAGGKIIGKPSARRVEVAYKHFSRQNLMPGFIWSDTNSPTGIIYGFASGNVTSLRISARLRVLSVTPPVLQTWPSTPVYVVIKMSVWVEDGSSNTGLKRTYNYSGGLISYNPSEWDNTLSNDSDTPILGFASEFEPYDTSFLINTPPVPLDGTLRVTFELDKVLKDGVEWFTADAEFEVSDFFLESIVAGNVESLYQTSLVKVSNDDFPSNSEVIQREVIIGDGPYDNTFGRIEANTGSGWDRTNGWRHYASGAYLDASQAHNRLLADDIMSLRSGKRFVLDTSFICRNFHPGYGLIRNLSTYLFVRGRFDLLRDEVRGTWHEVITVKPTQTDIDIVDIDLDPGDTTPLGPGDTGNISAPPPPSVLGPVQLSVNTSIAQTTLEIESGTNYTLLEIDVAAENLPLLEGTQLILTHPYTGQTQTVTLTADYLEGVENPFITPNGDTWTTPGGGSWIVDASPGLAIESFLAANDFPIGTYVQVLDQSQVQLTATMSEAYELFTIYDLGTTLTTGTSDEFWRPVDQVGWRLKGVTIALGDNPNSSTVEIAIRHKDNSGNITTIATYVGDSLTFSGPLNSEVLAGYYYPDVISAGTGVLGLQIAYKIRKTL